jgi:hypothetical protein
VTERAATPRSADEAARPVDPTDLYDALRLGLEGTERDLVLFARLMQIRYPHIPRLGLLNARHGQPIDILRALKESEGEAADGVETEG